MSNPKSVESVARAIALAEKVTAKASATLDGLDREMILMKWPAEFREIMWGAVASLAERYAADARKQK